MLIQFEKLPTLEKLRSCLMAMSALDIILCEEDWLRVNTWQEKWTEEISLAKIDNGAGDDLFIIFSPDGCIVKGFDHESGLSPHAQDEFKIWDGIYDKVPERLIKLLDDEAFSKDEVTFCVWNDIKENKWCIGDVYIPEGEDDGSDYMLGRIYKTPEEYLQWAEGYFDELTNKIPLELVKHIYEHKTISGEIIKAINPERDIESAMDELSKLPWKGEI